MFGCCFLVENGCYNGGKRLLPRRGTGNGTVVTCGDVHQTNDHYRKVLPSRQEERVDLRYPAASPSSMQPVNIAALCSTLQAHHYKFRKYKNLCTSSLFALNACVYWGCEGEGLAVALH